nr:protein app1-like [Crassostrea gigas]
MALERLPKNSYLQKLALKKNGRKSENEDAVSKDDENEAILRVDGAKADSAHTFQAKKSSKEQNAQSLGAITSKDIPSSSQLQRTAGDESGRETPVEVTNAVARTLEVAQEQSSDDTAAMEEQAETESQEDAHASHEKTLLLESSQVKVSDQDSTNWKGSSGTNSDDAQSVAYSEENQDSGKNDLKDEDIKNSFSKRDDEVENIGASDFKSTEQRGSVSNTEKPADITATEKEPSISEEESVGPKKPIPDSSPAVPAAESGPVVPVVESGPVVPVVESGPVVPVVESGPVVPAVESGPVVPVVESGPVVPAAKSGPVVPAAESGPVVPAAESGPVVPVVDAGPVVPVVDAGPVVPFVEAGPVVPVAESGPVVPADESAPVAKSGPEMSVAESSPVVPAAESGPVVPAAGSDLVVPAVESGPDDKAAESVPVVSADESFVGEEELVIETKTIAEQESSQTADTADKEDSNEEEQTVEVGAVSCSVEAVVTTEEDSQQNSEAKGDETENGGEGTEHAEEHPVEDRKDSHQAVMNPAESGGRVDEIAQIAESLDIITHHEEEVKDGVESSAAESESLEKVVQPSEETKSPAGGTGSGTDTQEKITESAEIAETSGETEVEGSEARGGSDGNAINAAVTVENGESEIGDSTNTDTENPTETKQDAPTVEDQLTEDGTTASKEDHTAEVPAVTE